MAKNSDSQTRARTASSRLEELARDKSKTKRSPNFLEFIAAGAVILALVAGSFFAGRMSNPVTPESPQNSQVSQVDASVSGKSVEEDQKAALKASQDLLNASVTDSGSYQERMTAIEQGDISTVTEEMSNGVYFSESMNSEAARVSTYQSLVALSGVMLEDGEASPNSENEWQNVQVDSAHGIAYVPLGIFTGTDVPFTFEMVYVDGEWKLAPFSLLQAIKMSSTLNSGQTNGG